MTAYALVATLIAGAYLLYPEAVVFHLLILLVILAAAATRDIRRPLVVCGSLALGLLIAALIAPENARFVLGQIQFGTGVPINWWSYFSSYLLGLDPEQIRHLQKWLEHAVSRKDLFHPIIPKFGADTLVLTSGILGTYLLDPEHVGPMRAPDIVRVALLLVMFGGILVAARIGWRARTCVYRLLGLALVVGLVGFAALVQLGQLWSAGKALSFIAPLLVMTIIGPGMIHARAPITARLLLIPWVLAQAHFVLVALVGLFSIEGVRLPAPYPLYVDPAVRKAIEWDISAQLRRVRDCPVIKIVAEQPFYRGYAAIAVYAMRKRYFYEEPVNTSYFGGGVDIGHMPQQSVTPRCEFLQERPTTK
jgi:hypothetical protein